MLVLSMLCFGTIGYFVRNIPLPSGEIALYRAVLAAVLIGFFMLFTKKRIPFKSLKKELLLLFLSGAVMGVNWILLFQAYNYTTVSVATLCYYFAPVIVAAVSPFLFKEKAGIKQYICFFMATAGIVLITVNENSFKGEKQIYGILFGLSAAVFYATVVLINKYIKKVDGISRTFLQFVSAVIVLAPYVLLTDGINLSALDKKGWISLLIVGLVHTGITYCLYFSSIKSLNGQTAAVLSYIDPLVAVLVSTLLLGEDMGVMQIIGGALILVFTLLNEIKLKKEP